MEVDDLKRVARLKATAGHECKFYEQGIVGPTYVTEIAPWDVAWMSTALDTVLEALSQHQPGDFLACSHCKRIWPCEAAELLKSLPERP